MLMQVLFFIMHQIENMLKILRSSSLSKINCSVRLFLKNHRPSNCKLHSATMFYDPKCAHIHTRFYSRHSLMQVHCRQLVAHYLDHVCDNIKYLQRIEKADLNVSCRLEHRKNSRYLKIEKILPFDLVDDGCMRKYYSLIFNQA